MAGLRLTRYPPPAEGPAEYIELDCSGLDPKKTIELLVNGVVLREEKLTTDGVYLYLPAPFALSAAGIALGGINHVQAEFPDQAAFTNEAKVNLLHLETDDGSVTLRYKA